MTENTKASLTKLPVTLRDVEAAAALGAVCGVDGHALVGGALRPGSGAVFAPRRAPHIAALILALEESTDGCRQ